jgi:parvulin-like peptidyl-prolyl isomerase
VHRVFRQFATLALLAAIALSLAACGGATNGGGGKDVAATVNGKEITLADVDRIVSAQAQGQQLSTLQQAAARLQVLDGLIERQVLYTRAEKEKTIPTDDEVNTLINQQKQRGTAEDWAKSLKENNLTEERVRDEARKDLAIRKLQEKVYGKIEIRDQEITDFYNTNKEQFVNPRGVSLSAILSDPRDMGGNNPDDAKSDADAKAKIDRIYAQLKGGADFATVAQASSEDQSAIRGGDIGFFNEAKLAQAGFPGELVGRFFNAMRVGDVTEPIHFPLPDGRWGIFKLTNRQLENKPLTLDDPGVRDQIRQALIDQRQQILQVALVRNALSDATVVNNLAQSMLGDPNMLGGNQSVAPGASPAASPAANATPAAATTPAPTASPAASPAAANTAATPGASPKR